MALTRRMFGRLMCGSAGMILAAMGASPAFAQSADTGASVQLAPIVLKGKGSAGSGEATPLTTVTDRETIQKRMVDDFKDLGRRVDAGVNVNSSSKSINLRGLDRDRVLTTLDGIRVPWLSDPRSTQGGLDSFDFDGLGSVEITKGTDSSRYGSGALGGVIMLRTLDPSDVIGEGRNWGAITKGTYDSSDESWRTNAAIAARSGGTEILVQGGYREGHEVDTFGEIGGYGATRSEANPGDYDQRNLLVKLYQNVEGGHRFGLTGEITRRNEDVDNFSGTTSSYVRNSLRSGEDSERKRISGSYDYVAPDGSGWVDEAHAVAYWVQQTLNNTTDGIRLPDARARIISGDPFRYGYPSGVYQRDNELKQDSYGFTGHVKKSVEIGDIKHTFRLGAELYRYDLTQYSAGVDNCPDVDWSRLPQPFGPQSCRMLHSNSSDMPDVKTTGFGIYLEDDIELFGGRLTLTPGGRFDWYEHSPESTAAYVGGPNYSGSLPDSNSDSRFTPKLRATWHATPDLDFYAQWAQGYRMPSAMELYQNYGAPGSYARLGNADLKPETSNGFEIGTKYDDGTYALSASVFNNYYRNFIYDGVVIAPPGGEYPVGGITGYANLNKVHIYGAEISGQINFANNWYSWASVAWTVGKDTEADAYLNSIPPLRGILGVGYNGDGWGADVSLTMAARRDKVSGSGFVAPGYGIVDATAYWEPKFAKGMKLQLGVFNIFDKKYWNATDVADSRGQPIDYYTEAGRSVRVSLTQKF
ncbi:TonB-dependent hemoglobin/transferrin/lactoferrin family receptor [Phyllobacterium sp. 21LDTY02-6]|uniref:TonB-dependent hemoglobin/transferrin/lactoferrin family receptor n=1 Tax=Phyllobacterium sp. 21LDTY02-6 TaxID=2944903 RepID=UPI00202109BA|nr:TonB-dependent hemoglobin/transferrin/lactoferrin family receptor [Phyllobacterium sp. 21LDTY02-6]MCO4315988.1 TonB-dependent hemoglobin/transferrin/lactoferrin family receptor [Phyllobacterium sp. 21LDTY02-6]